MSHLYIIVYKTSSRAKWQAYSEPFRSLDEADTKAKTMLRDGYYKAEPKHIDLDD